MAVLELSDLVLDSLPERGKLFVVAEAFDGRIRCTTAKFKPREQPLLFSQTFPLGCTVSVKVWVARRGAKLVDTLWAQCVTPELAEGLDARVPLFDAQPPKTGSAVFGSLHAQVLTGTQMRISRILPEPLASPAPSAEGAYRSPRSLESTLRPRKLVRVLSIDGGGVRGVLPAVFLAALESRAGRQIHELFDVVAGTSTGGLLAVAVGHSKGGQGRAMSSAEILSIYARQARDIFPHAGIRLRDLATPRGEAPRKLERLERALDNVSANISQMGAIKEIKGPRFDRKGLDGVLRGIFPDDPPLSSSLIPTIVTTYDLRSKAPIFFKSWQHKVSKVFALQCTSAAPTYFAPPCGTPESAGEFSSGVFIDGGVAANNPSLKAFLYTKNELYTEPGHEYLVVSLGTGVPKRQARELTSEAVNGWGLLNWLLPQFGDLVNMLLDVGSESSHDHMQELLGPMYFRFQHEFSIASLDMDDSSDKNLSDLMNEETAAPASGAGSQIYTPFRALGLLSGAAPFAVQQRGTENYVTVPCEKSFHIYHCAKLHLVFVGPEQDKRVRAVAKWGDVTLAACGKRVHAWDRGRHLATLEGHSGPVDMLLVLGDTLVSCGRGAGRQARLWDLASYESDAALPAFPNGFSATCVLHPDTYVNKVLFGGEDGSMQLWNVHSRRLVYEFAAGDAGSEVTALAQSPVVDVVAVGRASGDVEVRNLRVDEVLFTLHHAHGAVTALAFRTDSRPVLASAGSDGTVSLWDLEKRALLSVMDAHDGPVSSAQFLYNEPVLLTSSADNSLKMWVFDQEGSDGAGRLLRSRAGHRCPPSKVRFYGEEGDVLLSAGNDRSFRFFCALRDQISGEISQKKLLSKRAKKLTKEAEQLKLPNIVDIAGWPARDRDWDSILTAHSGSPSARTWSFQNRVIGKHELTVTEPKPSPVRCVAISFCGNFGFLGSQSGWIDKFNMQSGFHRGSFVGHKSEITGLASDNTNKQLISASLDGTLRFWDFTTAKLISELDLGVPITHITLNRDNNLLAVATDDACLRVYDATTRQLARRFDGHVGRINDTTFSPDGRWLVSASADCTVRTWDIPTGRMLDWFACRHPATSLSFAPRGEFLATSHVGQLGIYLWANRSFFTSVLFKAPPPLPSHLALPSVSGMGKKNGDGDEDEDMEDAEQEVKEEEEAAGSEGLIRLSRLPASRWQTLPNLDAIRERNRPKQPVKEVQVPFFLPTVSGLETQFATPAAEKASVAGAPVDAAGEEDEAPKSRILSVGATHVKSAFQKLLDEGECTEAMKYLMDMSASAIDFEIRSLPSDIEGMRQVIEFFCTVLETHENFEVLQAYISLFFRVHSDFVTKQAELTEAVRRLARLQKEAWTRLERLFHANLCMQSPSPDSSSSSALAGAWVVELGYDVPHKERQALKSAITSAGGTILFAVTSKADVLVTTQRMAEDASDLKVTTALRLGVPVVTPDYVRDSLASGRLLGTWPYRYLGPHRASSFGPSAEAVVTSAALAGAWTAISLATSLPSTGAAVASGIASGVSDVLALCRAVAPGASACRDPRDAVRAAYAAAAAAATATPSARAAVTPPPRAGSAASARVRAVRTAARVPAAAAITRADVSVMGKAPQSAMLQRKQPSALERMRALKEERDRVREEEHREAEERAREARTYEAARPSYVNGELAQSRAQARQDRADAARALRERRAAAARERLAELEKLAAARNAQRERAERKLQELTRKVRGTGSAAEPAAPTASTAGAAEAAQAPRARTQLEADMDEATAAAELAVAEAEGRRQAARRRKRDQERAHAAYMRMQRDVMREVEARRLREQRAVRKEQRRREWAERARLEDIRRRQEAFEAWKRREQRRKEREAKRAARALRNEPLPEVFADVDARKVFVGNVRMDDIERSSDVPQERKAAVRQTRINALCAIFRAYGTVTQWRASWDKGYAFVVYRRPLEAQSCLRALADFAKRKEHCDGELEKLGKTRPQAEASLAAPRPNFYVRTPK
eukprot:m51a1_g6408 putative uncharacterized wd repeat-containing (1997) ;mRNA; f:252935-263037